MVVYWIHTKEHLDPKKYGYIGVTRFNPMDRFNAHLKNPNLHLRNALEKYKGNIVFSIICEFDDEDLCLLIEEEFRSNKNIGWNIAKGGGNPPNMKGVKLNLSKEQIKIRSERIKGRNNPLYGKSIKKSKKGIESIIKHQKELSKNRIHIFQNKKLRKDTSFRLLELSKNGNHPLQNKELRKRTSERMKNKSKERREKDAFLITKRNKIMNSIEYTCPYCNLVGRGPNMKRYHFNNCKKKG